jgi:hypothetical protein
LAISFGSIGSLLPVFAGIFVQIGVSITPGWTVLTRTPSSAAAHSIATAFANRRTPPFVAQYPAKPADPRRPATDDMMIIDPPPARRMAGTTYFTERKTPSRFTAVCRRQSANDISTALHRIPMPALATITSSRPKRRSVASITPGQLSSRLTS